jgi:hypothetical protein
MGEVCGHVCGKVATRYIASNGLAILYTDDRKLLVAQAAWKASEDAMREPELAAFPNFLDIQDESLRNIAQSLLDIPVEIRAGEPIIMGQDKYLVSMTSVIAVVLADLLDENANVFCDWEGFELTAALGEWNMVILETRELS